MKFFGQRAIKIKVKMEKPPRSVRPPNQRMLLKQARDYAPFPTHFQSCSNPTCKAVWVMIQAGRLIKNSKGTIVIVPKSRAKPLSEAA